MTGRKTKFHTWLKKAKNKNVRLFNTIENYSFIKYFFYLKHSFTKAFENSVCKFNTHSFFFYKFLTI